MASSTNKEALLIGVDFGTTYSGIAWCYSGDPNTIKTIKNWPGGGTQNFDKVQTILSYNKKDPARYKWGYEVKDDDVNQLSWFKLLLDQKQESSSTQLINRTGLSSSSENSSTAQINHGLQHMQTNITGIPPGKKPIDLVTDYLASIHKHTMAMIQRTYPSSITEQFGTLTPIKYCLTVPAVWSDTAKELTKLAAKRAGMSEKLSEIRLITEPEAAAIHCLQRFQSTPDCLKVGDIYVIADCGGGTVDLITYEITATTPHLRVKECATGDGGLFGSTTLNRRFEELVKKRMGHGKFEALEPHAQRATRNHFDQYLKIKFTDGLSEDSDDDDEDQKFFCPVPGAPNDASRGIKGGFLAITRDEMKSIFLPSFQEIERLILSQVQTAEKRSNRSVTGVLLVGGFGSSEYLYGYLKGRIHGKNKSEIKILQPPDAWTAIVRGAVFDSLALHQSSQTGAEDTCAVDSRIARFSYGVKVNQPFNEVLHDFSKRFYDRNQGIFLCQDRMLWLVKRGDQIPSRVPKSMRLRFDCSLSEIPNYLEKIYCSEAMIPPLDYTKTNGIYKLCNYKVDFSSHISLTTAKYQAMSPHGHTYRRIEFEACLQYGSELIFSSQLNGKTVNEVTVEYNHDFPKNKQ